MSNAKKSKMPYSAMAKEMEKCFRIRIQINVTSRGSPFVHAYHVWLTSVKAFMSYAAHSMTD